MASLADQQAGRDFESYDDDRKEGRTDGFAMNAAAYEPPLPDPRFDAVMAEVNAKLERAFGKFDRATGRFIPPAHAMKDAA